MANGIDKLSSAQPKEIFSTIAPIAAAVNPIKNSVELPINLGVNKTTMLALKKNVKVPSKLLASNLCFPNFLPISAAAVSLIIKIVKAVTNSTLGNIIAHRSAEISTYVAPFKFFFLLSTSCFLRRKPKYL